LAVRSVVSSSFVHTIQGIMKWFGFTFTLI
jgi:hypothetical protein